MNQQSQTLEATVVGREIRLKFSAGDAVTSASHYGGQQGHRFVHEAINKAIGAALTRATELLGMIQSAYAREQEANRSAAKTNHEKMIAMASLFGRSLDDRLQEIELRQMAASVTKANASNERDAAIEEFFKLRSEVLKGAPGQVKALIRSRIEAASDEREQNCEAAVELLEKILPRILKLRTEIAVLAKTKVESTLREMLAEALPAAFGEDGIAPAIQPPDGDDYLPAQHAVTVVRPEGWRRAGHESDYSENEDDFSWDGTNDSQPVPPLSSFGPNPNAGWGNDE